MPKRCRNSRASAPAILLVHGDMDEVIPVDAMYIAREQLAQAGLAVEWHVAEGIGHGIDGEGLQLGGAFLKQAFAGRLSSPRDRKYRRSRHGLRDRGRYSRGRHNPAS